MHEWCIECFLLIRFIMNCFRSIICDFMISLEIIQGLVVKNFLNSINASEISMILILSDDLSLDMILSRWISLIVWSLFCWVLYSNLINKSHLNHHIIVCFKLDFKKLNNFKVSTLKLNFQSHNIQFLWRMARWYY